MKNRSILLVLQLLSTAAGARAATCIATDSGNWNTVSIWSCGAVPGSGDIVEIPAGITVTISSNIVYSGASIRIRIQGTLHFQGPGSKLNLPCGSILELLSSSATVSGNGTGNSQTLRICSATVWSVSDGSATGPLVWPVNATLPVELIDFSAYQHGPYVLLEWRTASEQNSDRFELQRSSGSEQYSVFANQPAAGHSTTTTEYTCTDLPPTNGTWYYRLVQYDLDGTAHEESVAAITLRGLEGTSCYPNPVSDRLYFRTEATSGLITITDGFGRVMQRIDPGSAGNVVDVSGWPNGSYLFTTDAPLRTPGRIMVAH